MDKDIKAVIKAHKRNLNKLNKYNRNLNGSIVDYLIESMRLLRDYYIVKTGREKNQNNFLITTIQTALDEFDKYYHCIEKYYKNGEKSVEPLITGSAEEVAEKFSSELSQHWKNFWTIVENNIGDWIEYAQISKN